MPELCKASARTAGQAWLGPSTASNKKAKTYSGTERKRIMTARVVKRSARQGSVSSPGAASKGRRVARLFAANGAKTHESSMARTMASTEIARVAIEASSSGRTFRGDQYAQEYHFLMRAKDGKIAEWKEYMDTEHARKVLVGE